MGFSGKHCQNPASFYFRGHDHIRGSCSTVWWLKPAPHGAAGTIPARRSHGLIIDFVVLSITIKLSHHVTLCTDILHHRHHCCYLWFWWHCRGRCKHCTYSFLHFRSTLHHFPVVRLIEKIVPVHNCIYRGNVCRITASYSGIRSKLRYFGPRKRPGHHSSEGAAWSLRLFFPLW